MITTHCFSVVLTFNPVSGYTFFIFKGELQIEQLRMNVSEDQSIAVICIYSLLLANAVCMFICHHNSPCLGQER